MTPMVTVLRNALESALSVMDPATFPELAEMKITLSNLTEATEINVSMYWDDDERAYRMATKVDTYPFILDTPDDITLEGDL